MPMSPRLLRPRAAVSAAFDPRNISTLQAWWDPADASSVTLNGTTISELRDKSGNGWHATQSTAADQPTYAVAGRNGRNVIRNAAGKRLVTSGPALATGNTWFLVCPPSTTNAYVISASTGNGPTILSGYGGKAFEFFHSFSDRLDIALTYSGLAVISTSFVQSGPISNKLNGTVVSSKATKATSHSGQTFARIGSSDPTGAEMVGDICEVILYGRALTADEISSVERYLGAKWGVTVA